MSDTVEIVEEPTTVEVVEGDDVVLVEVGSVDVVEVGIRGAQGVQGVQGIPGSGTAFSYVHVQASPSATWVVVHNLGGFPNATVVDSAGSEVEGDVHYDSGNQLTIQFAAPFGGNAYLS